MAGDGPKPMALQVNEDEDLYYDAYSEEDLINFMSNPNPNLMDLPFPQEPLPPPTGLLQNPSLISLPKRDTIKEYLESLKIGDDSFTLDTSDLLSGDLSDCIDYTVRGEFGNDNVGESGILEASTHVFVENAYNSEIGGSSTMPVPVITPAPTISQGVFLCTYCNLLRQLVHANGIISITKLVVYCYIGRLFEWLCHTGLEMMRLDLYGGIGYFCHAIIETRRFDGSNELRYQTCHLMDLLMEDVKKFIEDYCAARAASGFVIMQDTNADFYQAMNACTTNSQSLMSTLPPRVDIPVSLAMPNESLIVASVPPAVKVKGSPRKETHLSAQVLVSNSSNYNHLPS